MKREEKTRLTKEKIINAAIKEFGSKGYADASINSVSDTGIAKGLIYHNFSSKDELYIECLKVCFREITEGLSQHGEISDPKDYFDARMRIFNEKREMAAMVLDALINPPEIHFEEIKQIREPYDRMNSGWITGFIKSKKLRDNIDADSAMKYLAVMQDMFNWYCCNPRFRDQPFDSVISLHEEKLPEIFDYMLYGIIKEE